MNSLESPRLPPPTPVVRRLHTAARQPLAPWPCHLSASKMPSGRTFQTEAATVARCDENWSCVDPCQDGLTKRSSNRDGGKGSWILWTANVLWAGKVLNDDSYASLLDCEGDPTAPSALAAQLWLCAAAALSARRACKIESGFSDGTLAMESPLATCCLNTSNSRFT